LGASDGSAAPQIDQPLLIRSPIASDML
jgi:hypothetical protein